MEAAHYAGTLVSYDLDFRNAACSAHAIGPPRGRAPEPPLGEVETVANAPPHAVVNDRAER
jgi:hypothetical protein